MCTVWGLFWDLDLILMNLQKCISWMYCHFGYKHLSNDIVKHVPASFIIVLGPKVNPSPKIWDFWLVDRGDVPRPKDVDPGTCKLR